MHRLSSTVLLLIAACLQLTLGGSLDDEEVPATQIHSSQAPMQPTQSSLTALSVPIERIETQANNKQQESKVDRPQSSEQYANQVMPTATLEARLSGERNFIKDIIERLHALDADIGKLVFNSTSMYAPNDQTLAFQENQPKGGERFTEVLADLDSLQDEIGGLISNATRTRQYNMLVRLRPLNTILYRIRNNLHLMRNSLVAINTVASLERLGNNVLDSTLQAFLRPETNATDELGDSGNYDIDLDKLVNDAEKQATSLKASSPDKTTTPTTPTSPTNPNNTTTEKATTPSTTITTTEKPSTTTKATRPPNRRTNNRQGPRRNTTRRASTTSSSTTTTLKPIALSD